LADRGNSYGQAYTSVGWTYENGRGVQPDRVEGIGWYLRAAEQDDSWAQESRKHHHPSGAGAGAGGDRMRVKDARRMRCEQ
jgi:TPR repeat protein